MALDEETIEQQRALLAAHRRTLAHLLRQAAQFSAGHLPAHIANGIAEARAEIARIKAALREAGAVVEDHPNDEEIVEPNQKHKPPQLPQDASTWPFIDTGFALQVLRADKIVDTFRLKRFRMIVGRSSIADINLTWERFASRSHFAIIWEPNTITHFVEDWGHPNRIAINGKWVQSHSRIVLKEGDEIRLGETILRYIILETNPSEE